MFQWKSILEPHSIGNIISHVELPQATVNLHLLPNSSALYGKYYSPLGTAVTTTIANADFLTIAGRLEGAEYWFMTTYCYGSFHFDKSAASIDYNSATSMKTRSL